MARVLATVRTAGRRDRIAAALQAAWPVLSLAVGLLIVGLLVVQFASDAQYRVAGVAAINIVLVVGLYVFSGNSGILSFGHVSFMAIGAYTAALLSIPPGLKQSYFSEMPGVFSWVLDLEASLLTATLAAALVAGVFGLLVGLPISRLSGIQAAIATFALLQVVYVVLLQTDSVTRGSSAVLGTPRETTLWVAIGGGIVTMVVAYAYQQSTRGLRLRAVREDESVAQSAGIAVALERWWAMGVSAAICGVAGSLYAHFVTSFNPGEFYLTLTFLSVLMLVVGGMRSLAGAVVGAVFVSILSELLRTVETTGVGPLQPDSLPGLTQVVLAGILLATLALLPRGLTNGSEIPCPPVIRRMASGTTPVEADSTLEDKGSESKRPRTESSRKSSS